MSSSLWDAAWSFVDQSVASSSLIVRIISIVSLVISIAAILPLVVLVSIDILLYIWRIYWSHFPLKRRNAPGPAHLDATVHAIAASTTALDAMDQDSQTLHPR